MARITLRTNGSVSFTPLSTRAPTDTSLARLEATNQVQYRRSSTAGEDTLSLRRIVPTIMRQAMNAIANIDSSEQMPPMRTVLSDGRGQHHRHVLDQGGLDCEDSESAIFLADTSPSRRTPRRSTRSTASSSLSRQPSRCPGLHTGRFHSN
ncbi:hypothetical protein GY45DRAFT_533551 [Cubamyces sp. BRFM 1775]|nr:hypothetical protein GY45DRAFT_533551 [Cubamyces sp. BRFM 1775]